LLLNEALTHAERKQKGALALEFVGGDILTPSHAIFSVAVMRAHGCDALGPLRFAPFAGSGVGSMS